MAKNINATINARYTVVEDTPQTVNLLLAWTQEVAMSMHICVDDRCVDDVTTKLAAQLHGMTAYKDHFQLAVRREFNRLVWES